MSPTVLNPPALHDPVPFGYSHTVAVPASSALVLVAGQWGSTPEGVVVSADFGEQVRRTFDNLGVALAAHGLTLADVVQLRTYVVDHDFDTLSAIGRAVQEGWGALPPVHTVIGVASLATPDIRVEVEAVAASRASG